MAQRKNVSSCAIASAGPSAQAIGSGNSASMLSMRALISTLRVMRFWGVKIRT